MKTIPNVYCRIGTRSDLDAKITDAVSHQADGATVKEEADVIEISVLDDVALRAIRRGGDNWVFLFNPTFYPKSPSLVPLQA
jgi:hypothetical protein